MHSENGNPSPTKEQVGELYKESYRKFMEGFTVSNNKVRYYCNKTLSMRQSLYEILDDLIKVQYHALAYLDQEPETLDHFALSMVFVLISKTASLIDWSKLNHDCFWTDFCRETRQLRSLLDKVQVATFECAHTIVDKANRAFDILPDTVNLGDKLPDPRLKSTMFQSLGDPTVEGIKIIWMEPRETVIIQWNDSDIDEIQSVKLQQTCDNFKLRFLRCLIFYARKSLELILFTMLRVDITLRFAFPLEKLEKCQGLTSDQLVPHERAALSKSKRDFDARWDDILGTLCRFKLQIDQLHKHKIPLKRLLKDPKPGKINLFVDTFSLQIEDPLLLKIVSEAISEEVRKESYDFTMYPDRTEDIIRIIRDMWSIDTINYKKIDLLLILVYTALIQIHPVLNKAEQNVFKNNVNEVLIQKDRIKRHLKKALTVFKHTAFRGISFHQNGYTRTSSHIHSKVSRAKSESSYEYSDSGSEDGLETSSMVWVQLQGGYKVTIGDEKEFLVLNQFRDQLQFSQLDEEQKVVLTTKMVARLLQLVSTESCQSKITLDRSHETKSLMKRLKLKDRSTEHLVSVIANGLHYIQQLLKLMKSMEILRSINST